jgi:myo-inositol-1(or 4)-monophosphatase
VDSDQLREHLRQAEEAARIAAEVLESWRGRFGVREKGRGDLVTEADHEAQAAIYDYLGKACPGFAFHGEEDAGQASDPRQPGSPPTWIIDPIDGTINYVHDVPNYCVSIGLWDGQRLVVGVVYDPRAQEMYSAAAGQGAMLNGQPIRVSGTDRLEQALVSTGFSSKLEKVARNLKAWEHLTYHAQSLRRTGSTALNLAYVAAGRFDGYWAYDNHAWDVAGGFVLVQEAGGLVTRINGDPIDPFESDCVATNGQFHAELIAKLHEADKR